MKHIGKNDNYTIAVIVALLCMITPFAKAQLSLNPVQDITFTYSANMAPVSIDLSNYVVTTLPGTPTYETVFNYSAQATLVISGSIATVTPNPVPVTPGAGTLSFRVRLAGQEATGTINVMVYDYHGLPGLVNPPQFPTCYDYMGSVNFTSSLRFMTGSNDQDANRIYGFSIPLVADLNFDGNPEIIALGRTDGTSGATGNFAYINIYNGKTGALIMQKSLSTGSGSAQSPGSHASPGMFVVIDADRNNNKNVIIAFPGNSTGTFPDEGCLVSYEIVPNGTNSFTANRKWGTRWYPTSGTLLYSHSPVIQVVDFDCDGKPEILLYNRIYDAATGVLKVTMETFTSSKPASGGTITTAGEAFTGKNHMDLTSYDDIISFAYVYDVDLDGRYDVVAGGKVYYDIRPSTGQYKVKYYNAIGDGRTGVADMDGDGIPDIVVANRDGDIINLYVWNPGFLSLDGNGNVQKNYIPDAEGRNDTPAASFSHNMITNRTVSLDDSGTGSNSYIYIGDIDGRVQKVGTKEYRLPEVAILGGTYQYGTPITYYHPNINTLNQIPGSGNSSGTGKSGVIAAFTMDMAAGKALKLSFILEHNDRSVNTGFTMFDFDNDGMQEICYRDETTLRIIKANKAFVPISESVGNTVLYSVPCYSSTGFEYPVIADIDNDNSAEMIVIGKNKPPSTGYHYYGYIYSVGYGGGEKFAPALPVWNQFMYDPWKVTADSLTTPYGLAPNRLDPKYNFVRQKKDASGNVIEQINDYNPYNGTLRQGTKLDAQAIPIYEPIVFLTDAYIISDPSNTLKPKIVTSGNNHYIELTIGNKATAKSDISANTLLGIYKKNTISQATYFKTDTLRSVFKAETTEKLGTGGIAPGASERVWIPIGSGAIPGAGDAVVGDVYIVRLGDDSKTVSGTWTWRFGYNGGKYGTTYPCNDFAEGLGLANPSFRDCDWCDQTVRAARYQILNDLYTIQEYSDITMNLLGNDILPIVPLAGDPTKSFMDTVRLAPWNIITPPKAGYLSYNYIQGAGARVTYHYDNRANLPANIDSFQYKLTYWDDVKGMEDNKTGTVYIYILKDVAGGFTSCHGSSTRIEIQNKPVGVNFEWYATQHDNTKLQADSRVHVTGIMTSDANYWLKPVMAAATTTPGLTTAQINHYKTLNFPRGLLTIRLVTYPGKPTSTMRWTGHVSNQWRDPRNWVEVQTINGREQESPVNYTPAECSNVIIPSTVNNFPELSDSAICGNIVMKDRAMLRNPHVLKYANASVELKLKPSERDRFVMWSAPLMSMYSGDYHYRNSAGTSPQWGDVFMNVFQTANPDLAGAAEINRFTATFSAVNYPLSIGQAFNLKVTTTSSTRDSLLRFPRSENTYTPDGGSPLSLNRTFRTKFITHGQNLAADGTFNLPVSGDMVTVGGTKRLVQVVNPYMAYLSVDSFLKYNTTINNGYYIWNGETSNDFTVAAFTQGNRIAVSSSLVLTAPPGFIPPLQSFFVAKNTIGFSLTSVKMSPDWTTTSPPTSYTLRASTMVKSGGVMNITLSQGSKTAHAAMIHTIGSGPSLDREDMPAVIHTVDNETSLAVYTYSMDNAPLAINSSEHFNMTPVNLGLTVKDAGEYRLEFTNLESFGYDVILIDKHQNNKQIDLRLTNSYTFAVTKPSGSSSIELNNRFELRFTYTGKGITITSSEEIYPSPSLNVTAGRGYIEVSSSDGPIETLEIYNAAGRRVYFNPNINNTRERISIAGNQAIYIIKAKLGGRLHTAKTIIK